MSALSPLRLERVETDQEKAAKLKTEIASALGQICEVMTRAKKEGIIIAFQIQTDALGHSFVANLTASKEL